MPRTTIIFGLLLIALAMVGYALSDFTAKTALIPAFVGVPLLICGIVAIRGLKARMIAAHIAIVLAALGFLASLMPTVSNGIKLVTGEAYRGLALLTGVGMLVLCLAYVVLSIRSFIVARLAKKALGAVGK